MPAPLLSTVLGGQGVLPARGMEEASPGPWQAANVPSWKPAKRDQLLLFCLSLELHLQQLSGANLAFASWPLPLTGTSQV